MAKSDVHHLRELRGPRTLPFLGNLLQLDLDRLHSVLEAWRSHYGPFYRVGLGPRDVAVISQPDLVHEVLRERPATYRRMITFERLSKEFGFPGLFTAEGAAWRSFRHLTMEAFSARTLVGFYPSLRGIAERLYRRWGAAADTGADVDIADDFRRFTADVTMRLAFGHDVGTLEGDDDKIQRQLELVFPYMARRVMSVVEYRRFVRMPMDRRIDRAMADLGLWLGEIVEAARDRIRRDPARAANPTNLLDAMLEAEQSAGIFSNEDIVGNLLQMVLAGEDTTANTLAWAVHELCEAPEVIRALRQELHPAVGPDAVPATSELASSLAYVGAVVNETMRLRPVFPVLFLEAAADAVLGGVALPKGTPVWLLTRPHVMSPDAFADAEHFKPQRWTDGGTASARSQLHIPFGSGPRLCVGRSLALVEMKVALATLYRNFNVERVGRRADVTEHFSYAMHASGLRVRLRRQA